MKKKEFKHMKINQPVIVGILAGVGFGFIFSNIVLGVLFGVIFFLVLREHGKQLGL